MARKDHDFRDAKVRLAAFLNDLQAAEPRRRWEDLLDDEAVLTEFAALWLAFGDELYARARSGTGH